MTTVQGANRIHKTAIIADGAKLGADVEIGPYCVVGDNVVLGDGVSLKSHVHIEGYTEIGTGTAVFPFASLGTQPQDLKFGGEESRLVIGANTTIREHVTMNPGTEGGGLLTSVGDKCLIMVGAHVAHDCRIGNGVIMANNATLAGHVTVGDNALIQGLSAVHQFVRIGPHAIVGGMSGVEFDIIPYGAVIGNRAHLAGLNLVGLKRRGFPREQIHALRNAFQALFFGDGTVKDRVETVAEGFAGEPLVEEMLDFVRAKSDRGLCMPQRDARAD